MPVSSTPYTISMGEKSVDVHARDGILHGAQDVAIIKLWQAMRKAALDADFGGAQIPCFFTFARHVFERMKIGVGLARSATEGAKLAAYKTNVGEIDIPIHHVADDVANEIAPQRIGRYKKREQIGAVSIGQSVALFVG